MSNIFAIWKPKGPTSNDIVMEVKKITGIKKVGHAGTLDPLAEGVLVIGIGREATRKLGEVVKKEKEYIATIKLGVESVTDDEEGAKSKVYKISKVNKAPTIAEVKKVVFGFLGKISQTPPLYSAIKIKGKAAYKYARKGIDISLTPREVEVKSIKILSYRWPYLKIKVTTGPGVYIRSLARDIGHKLETGGYLKKLTRTRVGEFTKERSLTLNKFEIKIRRYAKDKHSQF